MYHPNETRSSTGDVVGQRSTLSMKDHPLNIENLVEPPLGGSTSDREIIEVEERGVGEIDGIAYAAHALVDDFRGGGLAGCSALDCDHLAAVWVAVGLCAH